MTDKKQKSEQKREQIIRGLMHVMAEKGYERASINAIAKEAKLTSGLVHYYFKTKQEILVALTESIGQRFETRYQRRMEGVSAAPQQRLDAFIDAYLELDEYTDPTAVVCWVVLGGESLHLPEVKQTYLEVVRASLAQLKLHLTEVLAAEGRTTDQVHALAASLMGAINGVYQLATLSRDLVPEASAAPTIKRMARGLIEVQPMRDETGGSDDKST